MAAISTRIKNLLDNMNRRAALSLLGTVIQGIQNLSGLVLANKKIIAGNSSGVGAAVDISGDARLSNDGKLNIVGGGLKVVAAGQQTLDTAGGIQVISNSAIQAGDIAAISLKSDDTGTAITKLLAVVAAGSLTVTRTDDGSSNDDAELYYVIYRGDEEYLVASGTQTLSTGGGTEAITISGVAANDQAVVCLISDDSGTPIPYTNMDAVCTLNTLTITRHDDGSSTDDAVCQYAIFRPAKKESTQVVSDVEALSTGGGTQVITNDKIKAGDVPIVSLTKDDTGTPITSLVANSTANTLTIVRTDDGSSADDGIAAYSISRSTPVVSGTATLSTGGGVHVITDHRIGAGDIAIVNLETDDTGTAIVKLVAAVTENTLTITRTDDGSSNDDAECHYVVFRP
jgi:hypothetical protein